MVIRVLYSGLLFFVVGIISIITGLIFTLMITRSIEPVDFGSWTLIMNLVFYVSLIQPLTSFWIIREIARGEKSATTGILSTSIFSLLGMLFFIGMSILVSPSTGTELDIMLFAIFIIPITFLNDLFLSITTSHKPHLASLSKLILEIFKVPLGIFFIIFLDLGIHGVIISYSLANIPSIIFLIYSSREKISKTIEFAYMKKWIRFSWISVYPGIYSLLRTIDVVIFSVITSSTLGLAYYGAALAISSIVMHSSSILGAVYPKLLSENKTDYLSDVILKTIYFTIPLIAISITFSRQGLFALNPIYESASILVIFLTIKFSLMGFNRAFENFLKGIEKIDINSNSTFRDYIQSSLFKIPTLRIIQNSTYLILLIIVLLLLNSKISESELLMVWTILGLVCVFPITVYLLILVRKNFQINLEKKLISKFILVSVIIFPIMHLISENFLEYDESLFNFIPKLALIIFSSLVFYVILNHIFDSKIRMFHKSIINEILKKNNL